MKIECSTTIAAAEVVSILMHANLRAGGAFRVTDPWPRGRPVYFIFRAAPPVHLVEQLRAISNTTIVEHDAA